MTADRSYDAGTSAQPSEPVIPPNTVDIGEGRAVVIPLIEYRALKALAGKATEDEREEAWFDAAIAEHEAWVAAGSPGGYVSHEQAMAFLLRDQ